MPLARRLASLFSAILLPVAAPAQNDDCAGALVVQNGTHGPFSSVGATTSSLLWPCGAGGNDLWFLYPAVSAGSLQVDVCGASFDTTLQVLSGLAGCGSLVSLGCNDDGCGMASSLTVALPGPGAYYVRIGGFAGQTGSFSLHVNGPAASGVVATNTALGDGCYRSFASVYQLFPVGAFDLAGTSFTMIPNGVGYLVLGGLASFAPPTASATVLALSDDSQVTVPLSMPFPYAGGTTSSFTVCSNGFVSVASGNGTGFAPAASSFLAAPQTGWWTWHDLNPPAGGQVKFEEIGGVAYVTWDGVRNFGGTSTADDNTFQMQFDLTSGFVSFVYQSMSTGGNAFLVGYSPGGASLDPGSTDLSVAVQGFLEIGLDQLPLAVSASTRPVLGTSWAMSVANLPPGQVLGVDVFGFADPGLLDLAGIGMPGCGLRATLDVLFAWVGSTTHGYSLPIPLLPSLVGLHLFTTSAVLQPGANLLGAITANGVDGGIGDL